jgi:hypothetical protein
VAIGATARAFSSRAPERGDAPIVALYLGLAVGLTALIAFAGGPLR